MKTQTIKRKVTKKSFSSDGVNWTFVILSSTLTHCGCILYRDPSMPTVVRRRATPLFSFNLRRMPARAAAIRLAERKDTTVQTYRDTHL